MVKNTIGGKKGKKMANKRTMNNDVNYPISTDENMIYVCVTKIFGGGVFQVVDNDKTVYKAFLRGKMKGSNKRHNLVSIHSILLAGIRMDSSDKSIVDILFVYDTHQIQTLSLIPSLTIHYILLLHSGADNFIDTQNTLFDYQTDDHNTNTNSIITQCNTDFNNNTLLETEPCFNFNLI
jgi:hypothetical protein